MRITKLSLLSGKTHTREIPVTEAQLEAWRNGMLIQKAMPNLSAFDREFLMSGTTPEEWEANFGSVD